MLDTRQANAIRKAVELNGAAKVQRLEYGTYTVPSASDRRGLEVPHRVDGAAVHPHLEVAVDAGGVAGGAHPGDRLPLAHRLTD